MAYNTYGDAGSTYGDAKGVYGQLAANLLNRTESGSGTDHASVPKVSHSRSETATGADASIVRVRITATQTSVVVDQVTVEMHIQEEFPVAVDSSFLEVSDDFTVSDSGTGTDSSSISLSGGGTPVNTSDSAHGTDSSTAKPHVRAFDTGTGSIASIGGGGANYFGGIYFGEYASGALTSIDGEVSTLVVHLSRAELGLALDTSIPRPHPPSPTEIPGLIVLRGKLLFKMGEGVLTNA